MSKAKKPNEIREEVRKQMAAKYKQDVESWKKRSSDNWNAYVKARTEVDRLSEENSKLKEQLAAQKDWIERLMEFIDMPDEERHDAVQKYIKERQMSEDFKAMFGPYFQLLNRMNLIF